DEGSEPVRRARARALEGGLPGLLVLGGEVPQGLLEQLVLAAEVQVDDALAETRLARDVGHRRFREALLGHRAQGGLDELLLADFLGRRAPPARSRGP